MLSNENSWTINELKKASVEERRHLQRFKFFYYAVQKIVEVLGSLLGEKGGKSSRTSNLITDMSPGQRKPAGVSCFYLIPLANKMPTHHPGQ